MEATQAGQTRGLVVKSEVYFRDRCHSREGARLQATLKDGTQLTLGENATLVVDEFIYDPSMSRGALSIRVRQRSVPIRWRSDRRGERGEGADTHAGWGDRPAGHHSLGRPNRQRLRSHRAEWGSHRNGEKGNCYAETRPGNDALRRRKTPACSRVAGGPNEARRRLNHVRKSAGSAVGELHLAARLGHRPRLCEHLQQTDGFKKSSSMSGEVGSLAGDRVVSHERSRPADLSRRQDLRSRLTGPYPSDFCGCVSRCALLAYGHRCGAAVTR